MRSWHVLSQRFSLAHRTMAMGALIFCACGADTNPGAANDGVASGGTTASSPVAGRSTTAGNTTSGPVATGGSSASPTPSKTGASGAVAQAGTAGQLASTGNAAGSSGKAPSNGGSAATSATAGSTSSAGTTASAGASATAGTAAPPASTGAPDKSAGCGMAPPASDTSIMVGGMTGTLIVDLPKNYDNNKPYPLILVWHGFNVTAPMFHDYLNIHAAAGDDAIVITPECLNGGTMWPADMSYPDALLEHFEASYCIDKNRLFTTGHSMGGMYTGQIGCQRGDKFRGDAVLAAPHAAGNCVKGKMAAMMSVGMSDTVASYMTEFSYWSMYGGCDMSMKNTVDPMSFYKSAMLDESGMCVDYGGCNPATPVRTCTFAGGHEIPPWVAGAVWDFFKKL